MVNIRECWLTSVLAIAILIRTDLLIRMGSGPIWNLTMRKEQIYCQKNWWKALLYIQNYVDYHERVSMIITVIIIDDTLDKAILKQLDQHHS
ncbi:hypothetical protein C0J52_18234 [Blattella germanica]|nr:hypothetical protein C0J52_18234 [Blattella germanica]